MSHALVFGASGVSGWALTNQALQYPSKDTFRQVTGLTNRPLDRAEALFPDDDRLQLVSGIDLTGSVDSIVQGLKTKVHNVSSVTHVYFTAYIEKPDHDSLREINTQIFQNAVLAIDQVAPGLKVVVLQTGGKAYGVEFPDKLDLNPPFKETFPRLPKPLYDAIFYYPQYDAVKQLAKGKSWSFYEVRPDVIVGFTPGSNFMNVCQGLGFYLTLWREIHGEGSTVPFIGTSKSWVNKHTDTSQDILAKEEIWVSLNSDKVENGATFNAADGELTTWEEKWPALCSYFGLKGAPPGSEPADFNQFASDNLDLWKQIEAKHGLKKGIFEKFAWKFMTGVTIAFDFDRQFDLGAIKSAGFSESVPTVQGYTTAFDRMRAAHIIP